MTFQAAVTRVREELYPQVCAEVLAQEQHLTARLAEAERECQEWESVKAATQAEVTTLRQELAEATAQRTAVAVSAPASPFGDGSLPPIPGDVSSQNGLAAGERHEPETLTVERKPIAGPSPPAFSVPLDGQTKLLTSSAEAIDLLEKNLESLGVIRVSARPLAREVLVAASLGQLLLFRGSFAATLAELVAVTLAYPAVLAAPVPIGASEPLALSFDDSENNAIIMEGINRSCLDAFGTGLQRQLRGRALGFTKKPCPIFLGTLGDGPSCLPPSPQLLAFGPMFNTDFLSWSLQKDAQSIIPGQSTQAFGRFRKATRGKPSAANSSTSFFPCPACFGSIGARRLQTAYRVRGWGGA